MINNFQEQLFQRMPPVRLRKLAGRKYFTRSGRIKNNNSCKQQQTPVSNNMALQYNLVHSTPVKNEQVTDLDEIESETELTEADLFEIEKLSGAKEEFRDEEPKLVISKIYDFTDNCACGSAENCTDFPKDESCDADVNVFHVEKFGDTNDEHWRSLENLYETAEYEFCRSLEESKLFVSTGSLLEEIEADLPSVYSLAKPLSYTFHTLTSYRTQTRLARMDGNLTCPEILHQQESLKRITPSKKIEKLEMEAKIQKAVVKQAEKALVISKANKVFGAQNVECEKALLLANLRHSAIVQEVKKLRMLGETPEKGNYGQVTISEICFEVNEPSNITTGTYICTVTEGETVQNTSVVNEVANGKLHFNDELKFSNLANDFVIYIDLFKLPHKEPKKTLLTSALKKKFKKMTAVNLSRSLTSSNYSLSGFFCIAQCELRLDNVERKGEKCVLRNYLTVNLHHPIAGNSVNVLVKTDIHIKSKQCGFLNVFKKTWHRRWFKQSGLFLESWHYPEDEESSKDSLDSVYLPNCSSVKAVGLEVCIRPHSFVIKLKKTEEEILFSANSHNDMLTWIHHLNLMFELIDMWKPNF